MEVFDVFLLLVFIEVIIIDVMFLYNMIIVNYGVISEWDWLEMIMDFIVVNYVDLMSLW